MKLTILGCNGALPAHNRFPTSMVLDINIEMFLIDCGEGCQMLMQKYNIKSSRIKHVFISHLHGDHYFGLIGWINSQGLLGRTTDLHIYANEQLEKIITIQQDWPLPFQIHFHHLIPNESQILIDNYKFQVKSFPVDHSIPTHGFLFTVKNKKRKIDPIRLQEFMIPKYFLPRIADGEDYQSSTGEIIKNEWVTHPGKPDETFAYCADTAYDESIIPVIMHAQMIYHEATYTEANIDKAIARKHATAKQAAQIAHLAQAQKLIIGHYSSAYKELDQHLSEAKSIFENTQLAAEGMTYEVN